MRPVGSSSPRPYGTPEEAVRLLITEVGGHSVATETINKARSTLNQYMNVDCTTSIQLNDLVALEALSSHNPVIRHLARTFGYEIFKPTKNDAYKKWLGHISVITKEFSELLYTTHKYLEDDDDIDSREARKVLKELDDHMSALSALRGDLVARIEGKNIGSIEHHQKSINEGLS